VGRRKDLEVREVRVGDLNRFLPMEEARAVQVRYNSGPVPCRVEREGEGWVARLEKPVMGVASGQSAVFYTGDGKRVVAGGAVRRGVE
jgi:tRNA U34 2-thiouridine synthase MnmA/TrmU